MAGSIRCGDSMRQKGSWSRIPSRRWVAIKTVVAEDRLEWRIGDQVSPSESFKRRAALLGGSVPPEQLAVLQNRDVYYYSHRLDLSSLP